MAGLPVVEHVTYEWRRRQLKGGKLPATRNNATANVFRSSLYLVGGMGAGKGRSSEVWRYSLTDDQWELVANKGHDNPPNRDGHSCTYIDKGSFLLFGGQGTPSPNEKSERNLDLVRTKTFLVRDLYNDLYKYDIEKEMWTMLCPEGGVPLCRRGHSAVYVPAGYNPKASGLGLVSSSASHSPSHSHGHGHAHSKGHHGRKHEDQYPPIAGNSVVVFGGSGMEVSKYIEAVYNDVWVYNIDLGRWAKMKTRGLEPKPLFDHRAERVGGVMVVVGGITSTNAKPFVTDESPPPNYDVMVLDLATVTWSVLELHQGPGSGGVRRATKLNLHGHSLSPDPYDPSSGILFVFGGKETVDGRQAAHESAAGAKRLLKKNRSENCTLQIDVRTGAVWEVDYDGGKSGQRGALLGAAGSSSGASVSSAASASADGEHGHGHGHGAAAAAAASNPNVPDLRYQHAAASLGDYGTSGGPAGGVDRPKPKTNYLGDIILPPPRQEPLLVLVGGSRVSNFGYCDNSVFELVRVRVWQDLSKSRDRDRDQNTDTEAGTEGTRTPRAGAGAGSVGGGEIGGGGVGAPSSVHSVHSIHSNPSYQSVGSVGSGLEHDHHPATHGHWGGEGTGGDEDDVDRKPSIWEKVQAQKRLAGLTTREPETTNWAELKLALTSSLTEKRIHGGAAGAGADRGNGAAAMTSGSGAAGEASMGFPGRNQNQSQSQSQSQLLPTLQGLPGPGEGSMSVTGGGLGGGSGGSGTPSSSGGQAPPMSEAARALEAKREKARIKNMSQSQVLPLVEGKHLAFRDAKAAFLDKYPPYVPPPVPTTSQLSASASASALMLQLPGSSQSQSQALTRSQSQSSRHGR